jgi:undecaprenyl pyrophosphate phosphatase UppP
MDLNLLQGFVYGLVSGFAEFMPVSAEAHEALLLWLFGVDSQHLLQIFVRLGTLAGLLGACRNQLARIRREQRLIRIPKTRRKRQPDVAALMSIKLLKIAAIPMLLLLLFRIKTRAWDHNLLLISVFLILNGIGLFVPERVPTGNKDSLSLSPLDGFLMGLFGGFSVLTGISRMGMLTAAASVRGTERQHGLNLALLLSIPALVLLLIIDIISLATAGLIGVTFLAILQCLLCAVAAFIGATIAIMTLRFLAFKIGYSGFAYYSWGMALFMFILFLTT